MTADELINQISHLIDRAETSGNPYDFMQARKLLNNDLREAIEPKPEPKLYGLTDGNEVVKTSYMTPDEYRTAQREAEEASGGNWWWYKIGPNEVIHRGAAIAAELGIPVEA